MQSSDTRLTLPPLALLLTLAVAAIWGFNFIVIHVGVAAFPPLSLVAIRFTLSAFPAMLFVKKPGASLPQLAVYGLLIGVGQFGLLFTAMKMGAPSGLSSIILQAQAFFTAPLAAIFLKERFALHNLIGALAAAAGLVLIGFSKSGTGMTPTLLAMLLAAALCWALANLVARRMQNTGGLALVVWSSSFSVLPLLALSLTLEGPAAILAACTSVSALSLLSIVYLVALSTLFGYGAWNHLVMKYGAGRIAPFSLLVPVFGVSSGALVLGERLGLYEGIAIVLVVLGLCVHAFGGRITAAIAHRIGRTERQVR